ncbi:glycosyltransferase family 2 protein [Chitinophaga filiformis]|uniref:glycosyltransferase family 2 protein n=1 Tax=Chitinophaga filiformis TaxID=104663 RepID=UPI001F2977F2|nr:glycosyltransferase family 2 protein [Chitinophaga filiformis]MCF6402784.1 glycosyltransferase family 2 protein [Chitinophaga filiformis]MCF6403298.1 glycosyltransferase family 2 protein [Chitinophaga filiformis]
MSNSLTVIILTYNEEKHITRCIQNLKRVSDNIIIIDSMSTDRTVEIATALGAKVVQRPWPGNHSDQFNWALDNCNITTTWTMRMDCDEYLLDELIDEINTKLPQAKPETGGFIIKRRVIFMDKWMKRGGFYPHRLLRIWRTGTGRLEERAMDEHVVLEKGETEAFQFDMVDHNLNDLTWWTHKQNNYASREVKDLLDIERGTTSENNVDVSLSGEQSSRKRWIKEKIYSRIPLFVRPFIYFIYRYFIRLGFLDGGAGLVWHFLQGFWYRFLVDAKMYELKRNNRLRQG